MGLFDSLGNWFKKELNIGQPASAPAPQPSFSLRPQNSPGINIQPNKNQPNFNLSSSPIFTPIHTIPPVAPPPPVHNNNLFNPFFHHLNQIGSSAASGVKDIGDAASLGLANITGNQQAANNARNAIGNNNINSITQDVSIPINAVKGIAETGINIGKATPLNPSNDINAFKAGVGVLTGNQQATQNALNPLISNVHTGLTSARQFGQGTAAQAYQLGESLNPAGGDVYQRSHTPTGGFEKFALGDQPIPSMQMQYKQDTAQHGKSYAATNIALTALMDSLGGKGTVKGGLNISSAIHNLPDNIRTNALKTASETAPVVNVPIKDLTSFEGAPDKNRVDLYKQQIQSGQQLDPLIAMKDSSNSLGVEDGKHRLEAYRQLGYNSVPAQITTPDALRTSLNAISQGGYAKVPGTPEPTPEAPQVGKNINQPTPEQINAGAAESLNGINDKMLPNKDALNASLSDRAIQMKNSSNTQKLEKGLGQQTAKDQLSQEQNKLGQSNSFPNDSINNQTTPLKGLIVKESKPLPDGSKVILRRVKNPETGKIQLVQERVNKLTDQPMIEDKNYPKDVIQYADTFGLTKQQAAQDLVKMKKEQELPPKENLNNAKTQLNVQEKRELIKSEPYQQTKNTVQFNPQEGNIKGAIAQATGKLEERNRLLENSEQLIHKLSDNDKKLLYRYDDGEKLDTLLKDADKPKDLEKAIKNNDNAFDYHLALDRASGGSTLRQNNYTFPKFFKLPEKEMDKLEIPENQRFTNGEYTGFHDTSAKYKSYLDAERQAGLKPLFNTPEEAIKAYRETGNLALKNQSLFTALAKAAPNDVADLGITHDLEGRKFTQAAGHLPFSVTDDLQKSLQSFKKLYKPTTKAGEVALKSAEKAGVLGKGLTFLLSPVHYANVGSNFAGSTIITGHGFTLGKGIGNGIVSISNKGYKMMLDRYKENGTLDWANNAGLKLSGRGPLGRYTDSLGLALADLARKQGIDSTSQAGVDLTAEYNKVMGHKNYTVEGSNPELLRLGRNTLLAQNWTPSQLALLKDAGIKWEKNSRGIGLFNPGDVARSTVLGKRLTEATAAIIITAIIKGQMPTTKQVINEAGLNPNNPIPNIETNQKNSKGEPYTIDMPSDQAGMAVGLLTDPKHFLQARESPLIGVGTRLVTNQNWNGQQLADMSQPGAWQKRIEGSLKGGLPISLQNATNPELSLAQGALQDFGFRYKIDPNGEQAAATRQHFDDQKKYEDLIKSGKWSQIPGSNLKDVSPQEGLKTFNDQYAKANVASTKDLNGNTIPGNWNALSAIQKATLYLQNDQKTGAQSLSPTFYAAQALARSQPNRPHNPLFDLNGNDGKSFTLDNFGNVKAVQNVSRAQIALDYQAQSATSDQKAIILAANPWLKDYEKQTSNYSQNYIPNMTKYMQEEGWTSKAIDNYWAKHPSTAPPIASPSISPQVQNLMDQYGNISDPTQKAVFFQDNAKELGAAYTSMAIYKNQRAVAQGALPEQMYPVPNINASIGLAQLQKNPNHDKSISAANSSVIKNNPDLNQYLADSGIYNLARNAARYQYQDPGHPGLNAGQLLNLGRPEDQATLKGISNVASYDIGKNANGQYSFMGSGGTGQLADGYSTGGGYSKKYPKRKKIYMKNRRIKMRRAHTRPFRSKPIYVQNKTYKGALKINSNRSVEEQKLA